MRRDSILPAGHLWTTGLIYLSGEDQRAAFRVVSSNPDASVRKWASILSWNPARVYRFIDAVERYGLATVERSKAGTCVWFKEGVEGQIPDHRWPANPHAGVRPRGDISPRVRFAVFQRDGFRCVYCGAKGEGVRLVLDHVHPVARGGTDDEENLATACWDCNAGKSDRVLQGSEHPQHPKHRESGRSASSDNDLTSDRGVSRVRNTETHLGSTGVTGVTGPSERKAKSSSVSHIGDAVPWSAIAVRMIPVMNEEFTRLLGDAYRQILPDNRGSHRAGHQLEAAHVDPDWCEERLRLLCRTFNPSKHGGGQAPRTLAYFTAGLIRDWRQYTLPLLARVETSPAPPPPAAPSPTAAAVEQLPDPAPASDPTRWRREISLERRDLSRIGADDVRKASGG